MKNWASKLAHNWPRPFYFTVQPRPTAHTTAHSPESIFHIMKSRDQISVLLSVLRTNRVVMIKLLTSLVFELKLHSITFRNLPHKKES